MPMNYQRIYDRIISRAKERKLDELVYRERHHIIPRCMNGTDDEDNLVDLTPEEHYVCHQLLVKMYPGNRKLVFAAKCMTSFKVGARSNKMYGWLKRRFVEVIRSRRTGIMQSCVNCKNEFYVTPHKQRLSMKCCSKKCHDDYKRYGPRVELQCPQCNKMFTKSANYCKNKAEREKNGTGKYMKPICCSKECQHNYGRVTVPCHCCGVNVEVFRYRYNQGYNIYCSKC